MVTGDMVHWKFQNLLVNMRLALLLREFDQTKYFV